jgi:hypothetical protein
MRQTERPREDDNRATRRSATVVDLARPELIACKLKIHVSASPPDTPDDPFCNVLRIEKFANSREKHVESWTFCFRLPMQDPGIQGSKRGWMNQGPVACGKQFVASG